MTKSITESEYFRLQNEANALTVKINQTFALSEKQRLQTIRGNLLAKVTEAQDKLEMERDKDAWNCLVGQLEERKPYIVVEVNGAPIKIPENLMVEISYNGCKHKQKMHLAEVLRYQRAVHGNVQLLNAWNSLLKDTGELTSMWWCEQCREEKNNIRAKFFRYDDKPCGQTRWKIKHFNINMKV